MSNMHLGTAATRDFYEQTGWARIDGVLVDTALFTPPRVGPILNSMIRRREELVRELLGGHGLSLVECGCGGTPALYIADLCRKFTAVDFSAAGLSEAAAALAHAGVPFRTVEADMTRLPFGDGEFEAAYSAHVLYHIDNSGGQAAALGEMMRVVRPGGRVVLILANPFPLLFPLRFIRRVLAATPLLGALLNAVRPKPPLPYRPMSLGWYRRQLSKWGDVRIIGNALPSTWFDREVSENTPLARAAWKTLRWLEESHPRASARLGCYVTICVTRRES
jgi:SAM-dependent methyltransferase